MSEKQTGFIGTYTKEESKGIYRFTFDGDERKISDVTLAAELTNPTYVTVSNDKKFLYAVGNIEGQGGVKAYAIDPETHELEAINAIIKEGPTPCHISVSKDRTYVVTANYNSKEVVCYRLNKDGSLKDISDIKLHEGSGPHDRQDKPHMHYAGFSPDERYVISVDLGSDAVTSYRFKEGKLTKEAVFHTPAGSGPRHIAFHPNNKIAYVMTELSSEVLTLKFDQETGRFTLVDQVKTIPESHKTVNDGSAVHISSDGRFVYVGNRGHNSIAVFKVDDQTFNLSLVEYVDSLGDWPRDFALTPDDAFIICSNKITGTLTLFERHADTGKLTAIQQDVEAPESICVKFL